MKRFLLSFFSALFALCLSAQSSNVEYSDPFDEPEGLESKVFQQVTGDRQQAMDNAPITYHL